MTESKELKDSNVSSDETREKKPKFNNRAFGMICLGIIFFILFGFVAGTLNCP